MRQYYALFLLFWTPVILSMDPKNFPKPPVSSPRPTERKHSGEKAQEKPTRRETIVESFLKSATSAFSQVSNRVTPQPPRSITTSMFVHDGSESDSSDNESEKDQEKKDYVPERIFSRPSSPDEESKDC